MFSRLSFSLILFLFFVLLVSAQDTIIRNSRNSLEVPRCWKQLEVSESNVVEQLIKVYISLKNRNVEWLKQKLYDSSDPLSNQYGQHATSLEIQTQTSAPVFVIKRVYKWLTKTIPDLNFMEISKVAFETNYIPLVLTVHQAETLFQTKFLPFQHDRTKLVVYRTIEGYSIPKDLDQWIAFIGGVNLFPSCYSSGRDFLSSSVPEYAIVNPARIRNHYNISDTLVGQALNNNQAVAEFEDQWYDSEDLSAFFERNNLPDNQVDTVIGFNNDTQGVDGGEADLDIQYLMGIGVNVSTWFISLDKSISDPFLEWIILLLQLGDQAPLLHSTSYGDDERNLSPEYLDRVSEDFMKFGSTGHTLFYSSGDYGVGCDCDTNSTQYVAHFPASSPYVTSIGGTISMPTVLGKEVGVSFSGGGFSTHFSREEYQQNAVTEFLKTSPSLPSSGYNSSNRGYPDMSAWALNYEIYEHGNLDYIGGTSASTPTVAGMFSLINDQRLLNSLPPLGFLNPAIYYLKVSNPEGFNDILSGNNGNKPCCEGFTAQKGWDPMTGVGSPNMQTLPQLFLQLATNIKKH